MFVSIQVAASNESHHNLTSSVGWDQFDATKKSTDFTTLFVANGEYCSIRRVSTQTHPWIRPNFQYHGLVGLRATALMWYRSKHINSFFCWAGGPMRGHASGTLPCCDTYSFGNAEAMLRHSIHVNWKEMQTADFMKCRSGDLFLPNSSIYYSTSYESMIFTVLSQFQKLCATRQNGCEWRSN